MNGKPLVFLGGPYDRQVRWIDDGLWFITVHVLTGSTMARVRSGEPKLNEQVPVEVFVYERARVRPAEYMAVRAGVEDYVVLAPVGASIEERNALLRRDERPVVNGGHRKGQPGRDCPDVRDTHPHICGNCAGETWFSRMACTRLYGPPRCQVCGDRDWRTEADMQRARGPRW